MFGAFKPSAPLSGGLLWKIPWRLSPPQKLRHRRRMRRVDNIVSILDTALKNRPSTTQACPLPTTAKAHPSKAPNTLPAQKGVSSKATPEELSQTAQGQRMLEAEAQAPQSELRHGRGPRQGELLPTQFNPSTATQGNGPSLLFPSNTRLGSAAREEGTMKLLERWKVEMPTEQEMLPRDKYTMFDRKARGYRKGVHKLPKWTRLSQRVNPPGF